MLGYPNKIYLLPFDHRSSFVESFLGKAKKLDAAGIKLIKNYKGLVYEGFLMARKFLQSGQENCAIMVDEEFGLDILKSAGGKKIKICLPVEKSGQAVFDFAAGQKFAEKILLLKPALVKVLVRYNPANKLDNQVQAARLKILSAWCRTENYKFMLELLVPPTVANLKRVNGKRENYDKKIRPRLTKKIIEELHAVGVEPDIWKIEAFENKEDWPPIINTIRSGETRREVGIIMLGRGESFAKVKFWMAVAPKKILNGFAVGRTVFLRPLLDLHAGQIDKTMAVKTIAQNYLELIKYWERD